MSADKPDIDLGAIPYSDARMMHAALIAHGTASSLKLASWVSYKMALAETRAEKTAS